MSPINRPIPHLLLLSMLMTCMHVLVQSQELRAGYQFTYGTAWSAEVDLPRYHIVDLGQNRVPLAVNDSGVVLLRDEQNRLIRWTWGKEEILREPFTAALQAFINNSGLIAISYSPQATNRIHYWLPGHSGHDELNHGGHLIADPIYVELYGLNDSGEIVARADASDNLFFVPENFHVETNKISLTGNNWEELARYEYFHDVDFSLTHGGTVYQVSGFNNYGDTVGLVRQGSGSSSTSDSYESQYYTLNMDYVLDFRPVAINDNRTILGVTDGPEFSMIMLDRFGQRYLGPVLDELGQVDPEMSSPANGLEEIILGEYYFKRMSERNLLGLPTGNPSPDFWMGKIGDVIRDGDDWTYLESKCISPQGRISGTGLMFDRVTGIIQNHAFLLSQDLLLTDWDRNGIIDTYDRQFQAAGYTWRFWINDDDDDGDLSRSSKDDLPENELPDFANGVVDGQRDIVDFFPLLIDLREILQSVPDLDNIDLRVRHAESALDFVYTNLSPEEVGNIHKLHLDTGFGPEFDQPLPEAPVHIMTPDGMLLNRAFIGNIAEKGRGVLLIEGRAATSEPIIVELIREGQTIIKSSFAISISPVKSMMRIINLRMADEKFATEMGPWLSSTDEPLNLPDQLLEAMTWPLRTLIHIHGFNWTGEEIPAGHAEIFKRYFQAGSNARFIGVSWHGDIGTLQITESSFEYNENVVHALITAKYVAEALQPFSGTFSSLFAHSLGNMVASSSIVDFGVDVFNYFMVNAAVPLECYDGETNDRRHMVHPDWKDEGAESVDYSGHLLATNWARLFDSNDHRSLLRWKNRFNSLREHTHCTNYYSSGEDVLKTGTGELPNLLEDVMNKEWVWVFNEMVKGTNTFSANLAGEVHGGWGFNRYYMDWVDPGGAAHPPPGSWVEMPPAEADSISNQQLITEPFFHRFSNGDADFPNWGDGSWLYGDLESANSRLPGNNLSIEPMGLIKNQAKVLAEAIPSHSAPVGSQAIQSLLLLDNIDMDKLFRNPDHWPDRDHPDRRNRWLHSDYLNPSFSHVFQFYRHCVEQINKMP